MYPFAGLKLEFSYESGNCSYKVDPSSNVTMCCSDLKFMQTAIKPTAMKISAIFFILVSLVSVCVVSIGCCVVSLTELVDDKVYSTPHDVVNVFWGHDSLTYFVSSELVGLSRNFHVSVSK